MSDEAVDAIENVAPTGLLTDVVDDYRRLRDELERSVLPLATSVDGRQLTFQASLHQLQFQTKVRCARHLGDGVFPALIKSGSMSSPYACGPTPSIPFSVCKITPLPGSRKSATRVGWPMPRFR